jgi:hypothetical protein
VGEEFWRQLTGLLSVIEFELSVWCATELDAGTRELLELLKPDRTEIDPVELGASGKVQNYAAVWGKWKGREIEYYRHCAELVERLAWNDVVSICGPQLRLHAQWTQAAFRQIISRQLPDRLKMGNFRIEGAVQDKLRIVSYRPSDPLLMSRNLAGRYFAGWWISESLPDVKAPLPNKRSI